MWLWSHDRESIFCTKTGATIYVLQQHKTPMTPDPACLIVASAGACSSRLFRGTKDECKQALDVLAEHVAAKRLERVDAGTFAVSGPDGWDKPIELPDMAQVRQQAEQRLDAFNKHAQDLAEEAALQSGHPDTAAHAATM